MTRFSLLLLLLAIVAPACASNATSAPVTASVKDEPHLVRYAYDVKWQGGQGLFMPREGNVQIMLQADLQADQQLMMLVRPDGHQLGRALQAGSTAFVVPTGQETQTTYDVHLGMAALGFPLSLRTVFEWFQGQDASGPIDRARIQTDAVGRVLRLTEGSWTIEYTGWSVMGGKGQTKMAPTSMTIVREGTGTRLELTLIEAVGFDSTNLPEGYRPIKVM